jgi:hypothetical protein
VAARILFGSTYKRPQGGLWRRSRAWVIRWRVQDFVHLGSKGLEELLVPDYVSEAISILTTLAEVWNKRTIFHRCNTAIYKLIVITREIGWTTLEVVNVPARDWAGRYKLKSFCICFKEIKGNQSIYDGTRKDSGTTKSIGVVQHEMFRNYAAAEPTKPPILLLMRQIQQAYAKQGGIVRP